MQLPLYLERVSADRGEMEASKAVASRLIGAIIVEKNLVTAEQLERALQLQEQTGERLGEIVVAEFGVSRLELAGVLAEQWADFENVDRQTDKDLTRPVQVVEPLTPAEVQLRRPIGEIFVELGFVTNDQLDAALVVQRETGARIGEVLVEQGSLSRLDLASALAEQWSALQKLRPPTPAPDPQPWQNGVPVLQSSPPENAAEVCHRRAPAGRRASRCGNAMAVRARRRSNQARRAGLAFLHRRGSRSASGASASSRDAS